MKKLSLTFLLTLLFRLDLSAQHLDSLTSVLIGLDGPERVSVLHQLTKGLWYSNLDLSIKYAFEALEISIQEKDSSSISESLRLIGSTYYYSGAFNDALDYANQSLEIALAVGDSSLLYVVYNNIGIINYELGGLQYAMENYLRAKNIREKLGLKYFAGVIETNIGLLFMEIGQLERALEVFRNSYRLSLKGGNENGQVYALNNMGIAHLHHGDMKKAMDYLKKGSRLAKEVDNLVWGSVSFRNIGEVYRMKEEYDSAIAYYHQSKKRSEQIGDKRGLAEVYLYFSKVALDQGKIDEAGKYLNSSRKIARQINARNLLRLNLKQEVAIYLAGDQKERAISKLEEYLKARDSLYNDMVGRNLSLTPLKLKEEKYRIQLSKQRSQLKSKDLTNLAYSIFILLAIPVLILLFVFLKKNRNKNTELESYNKELKQTQDLLVKTEKMVSLGVLAAGIGHEINNPLNFIVGGIKVIREELTKAHAETSENLQQYFDIIDEGVHRASCIVKSLAHFNRSAVGVHDNCIVEEIIDNCLVILSNKLRGIQIMKEYEDERVVVNGNEGKLHQVS